MKLILTLLLLLVIILQAWEEGQPGDYSYDGYGYQDYNYDVDPPDDDEYNYNADDRYIELSPDDIESYVDDSLDLYK